jgi:hypothetical protein
MEGGQGIINYRKAFACGACGELAYDPTVTDCCEVILCEECLGRGVVCPKCRTREGKKNSVLLALLQQQVVVECPYDCKARMTYIELKRHSQECPEATTECVYCKKQVKIRLAPEHLGE